MLIVGKEKEKKKKSKENKKKLFTSGYSWVHSFYSAIDIHCDTDIHCDMWELFQRKNCKKRD